MFVRVPDLLIFDDLSQRPGCPKRSRSCGSGFFALGDATCLVVSHRRAALQRADHIVVLKDDRIEAEGKLKELLDTCKEMQRLWAGDIGEPESTASVDTAL